MGHVSGRIATGTAKSPVRLIGPSPKGNRMTATQPTDPPEADVDPIDEEAAEIDARSPIAAEQIEELKEHAVDEGRAVEP
jgi:hypothetical protein